MVFRRSNKGGSQCEKCKFSEIKTATDEAWNCFFFFYSMVSKIRSQRTRCDYYVLTVRLPEYDNGITSIPTSARLVFDFLPENFRDDFDVGFWSLSEAKDGRVLEHRSILIHPKTHCHSWGRVRVVRRDVIQNRSEPSAKRRFPYTNRGPTKRVLPFRFEVDRFPKVLMPTKRVHVTSQRHGEKGRDGEIYGPKNRLKK